ncbi:MAG: hypothetical protein OXG70_03700 [Cyanobacteria bacterium MAG IRC1_bin_28]|nr:hypothetical protein [Cyanobacteria bacterium MAG IRC3_bin_20]MCY3654128.1 hypothetical protein [Cyanobacteria bacterium MAG IRC1_bin_28]MDE0647466.1 hypothetical protein [Cyanobacteria bacterium MAG IRC4_bin_6]
MNNTLFKLLPLAGVVIVPQVVPRLMVHLGIGAGVAFAVVVVCLWFALLVSRARMPGHG